MRPFLILLLCAALIGCSPEEPARAQTPTQAAPAATFPTPDYGTRTSLALIQGRQRLHVGDSKDSIEVMFPTPPRSSRVRELPPGFPSTYVARGWERNDEAEGLGVLLFQDRVAVAIQHFARVDPSMIRETVGAYQSAFGSPELVFGNSVSYWFWEMGPHVLMICAYEALPRDRRLTVALGYNTVAEKLGISLKRATADRDALEQMNRARSGFPLEPAHKG